MNIKVKGIVCMIVSAFAFSVMQILIAKTSSRIPVFEQMFFRNLATAIMAYVILKRKKAKVFGEKSNRKLLAARSVFGYLGMFCLFYATSKGTQGDVAILSKLSPFVVILCAVLIYKERMKSYQIIALIIAFVGAIVTANPTVGSTATAAIAAILASVFAGVAYFCVGALKGKERPEVIVFFFSAFSTVVTIGFMVFNAVCPSAEDLVVLLGISLMAAIGQMMLTYAYSMAKASEVSVFNYSGIPFSMLLGYFLLNQPAKITTFVGSLLVIASGIIAFVGAKKANEH